MFKPTWEKTHKLLEYWGNFKLLTIIIRAVGLPKKQIFKVSLYESLSNLIGAIFIGCCVGVIASLLVAILFMTTLEMPFTLVVS